MWGAEKRWVVKNSYHSTGYVLVPLQFRDLSTTLTHAGYIILVTRTKLRSKLILPLIK